jgi:hypothetical protein
MNSGTGGSGVVAIKELSKASGVWSLQSQMAAKQQGTWPELLFTIDYLVVAGGGGGGSAASGSSGRGGAGRSNSITGSSVAYAGG